MRKILLLSSSILALSACDLAPEYKLPEMKMPNWFKEQPKEVPEVKAPTEGKWQRFDEKAKLDETAWWRIFNDPALNALEEKAMAENPSVDAAIARVKAARAVVDQARADLFPEIGLSIGPTRQKDSVAGITARQPGTTVSSTKPYTLWTADATLTYELDLFGRTRNQIVTALMGAEAEAQNLRTARLSLQGELAQTYFTLATTREQLAMIDKTLGLQRESTNLTRKKRDLGEVDDLVVSSEEAALAQNEAARAQLAQQAAVAEHALAALVGTYPTNFEAKDVKLEQKPPVVPAGLPSSLLQRRPDIQAAAKTIAAANAQIGLARTGYFPSLALTLQGGFSSGELGNLFAWGNRSWLVGPLLTQPLFQGGRAAAYAAEKDADYQLAVANYRSAVLTAFREVEDRLSGLRNISDAANASGRNIKASKRAYDVASARYKLGESSYLEFITAQQNYLNAQRSDAELRGSRYITTVQLIQALGGGWDDPAQPKPDATQQDAAPVTEVKAEPVAPPAPEGTKPAAPEKSTLQQLNEWFEKL